MKFKKKAEGSFKHLERWIEDNHIIMNKKFDETYQFINERDNVFHQRVNNDVVELDKKIDSRVDKSIDMLTKEIDLKYQLMKETQNKLDDLWKAVENINNLKITK
jgi:peptidoglycan hydrolase CwlO-like protein